MADRHKGRRLELWITDEQAAAIADVVRELNSNADTRFRTSDLIRDALDAYVKAFRERPIFDRRATAATVAQERRRTRGRRAYDKATDAARDELTAMARRLGITVDELLQRSL